MIFEKIDKTLISLKVDERQVLFLVLAQDGTINRKGDGTPDCTDNVVYIGVNNDGLFDKLKPYLTKSMDGFLQKTYDIPDKKGRLCDLTILFAGNEIEMGAKFLYGELSQGPPKQFVDYCIKAIDLTEDWFQTQKLMRATAKKAEPKSEKRHWWKFW